MEGPIVPAPPDAPTSSERRPTLGGERDRIAAYYAARAASDVGARYSPFNPGHLFRVQRTERAILAALARHGLADLALREILDVGCGDGTLLRRAIEWGADRTKLHGVELLPERVAAARRADPALDVRRADASALPFADASVDLAFQMTVFSSILDDGMQRAVAHEMARVLRSGGAVVSYDLRVARDRRHTRAVRADDLRRLFPGFGVDARPITLIPPLARMLARWSWMACEILEEIPALRSHELVVLRKP